MAPHTLLIERKEFPAPVQGGRVACCQITRVIARGWQMSRAELACEIGCPPEAVRFSRVGPIHLAHAREWALGRELESLRWKLLYPLPLSIRGKAVAVRPDHQADPWRQRRWRALTEWEAINAERVLEWHGEQLGPCACDRWHGLRMRIHGRWAQRLHLAAPSEKEAALIAFARHEAGMRQLQRGLQASVAA
jgi:hypothetical protein